MVLSSQFLSYANAHVSVPWGPILWPLSIYLSIYLYIYIYMYTYILYIYIYVYKRLIKRLTVKPKKFLQKKLLNFTCT